MPLAGQRHLPISRRQGLNLLADFLGLLRAAQPGKVKSQRQRWQEQGGVVISIDGAQPEKGSECLYLVREVGVGLTLYAETLSESSHGRISREVLQPVKGMLAELEPIPKMRISGVPAAPNMARTPWRLIFGIGF